MSGASQFATSTSVRALMTAPGARGIKGEGRSASGAAETNIQADPRATGRFGNGASKLDERRTDANDDPELTAAVVDFILDIGSLRHGDAIRIEEIEQ